MGDYVELADVKNIRTVQLIGVSDDALDVFIDGVEARVNGVLQALEYPTVPATDERDKALLKEQIVKKVTAVAYMAARSPEELPEWIVVWNDEFEEWLGALTRGETVLPSQVPGWHPQAVNVHRLRVLPPVEDE